MKTEPRERPIRARLVNVDPLRGTHICNQLADMCGHLSFHGPRMDRRLRAVVSGAQTEPFHYLLMERRSEKVHGRTFFSLKVLAAQLPMVNGHAACELEANSAGLRQQTKDDQLQILVASGFAPGS